MVHIVHVRKAMQSHTHINTRVEKKKKRSIIEKCAHVNIMTVLEYTHAATHGVVSGNRV